MNCFNNNNNNNNNNNTLAVFCVTINNLYVVIFSKLPIFVVKILHTLNLNNDLYTVRYLCTKFPALKFNSLSFLTPHVDKIFVYDLCILLWVIKYFPEDMNFSDTGEKWQ
jgi:hypothetical protein